jgi:hypothetical protein
VRAALAALTLVAIVAIVACGGACHRAGTHACRGAAEEQQ